MFVLNASHMRILLCLVLGVFTTLLGQAQPIASMDQFAPDQNTYAKQHLVAHGETLSSIARKHKTSVATLREMNDMQSTVIYAGQHVWVPVDAPSGTSQPGEKASQNGTSRGANARRVAGSVDPPKMGTYYRSTYGPDVYAAAQSWRLRSENPDAQDIWARTNLDMLFEGSIDQATYQTPSYLQRAGVAASGIVPTPATNPNLRTRSPETGSSLADNPNIRKITHRVEKDEDLYEIAEAYGVRPADIQTWNGSRRIYTGQILTLYVDPLSHLAQPEPGEVSLEEVSGLINGKPAAQPQETPSNLRSLRSDASTPTETTTARTESGRFMALDLNKPQRLYLVHKTLEVGTVVEVLFPQNKGSVKVPIVGTLQVESEAAYIISPTLAALLKDMGAKDQLTLKVSQ